MLRHQKEMYVVMPATTAGATDGTIDFGDADAEVYQFRAPCDGKIKRFHVIPTQAIDTGAGAVYLRNGTTVLTGGAAYAAGETARKTAYGNGVQFSMGDPLNVYFDETSAVSVANLNGIVIAVITKTDHRLP